MSRKYSLIVFKLVIAVGLLSWTFRGLYVGELWASIRRVDWEWLAIAFLLQFLAYVTGSLRWWLLVVHGGGEVRFSSVQKPYYLGLFFNQFLPSSVGGDAVRIMSLYRQGVSGKSLLSSSLMDRIVGLIVLLWLGGLALYWSTDIQLPTQIGQGILAFSVLMPLVTLAMLHPWAEKMFLWFSHPIHLARPKQTVVNVLQTCRSYAKNVRLVFIITLCSIALQLCATSVYLVLGLGLGIQMHFFTYVVIISVVYIIASLPISVGGLGVRENVFVSLMLVAGVSRADAAALAIMFLLVLWVSVLPGLVFFIKSRTNPAIADSTSELSQRNRSIQV